jgi:hypothetical protein
MALEHRVSIAPTASESLGDVPNSFCALLALLAERRGFIGRRLNRSRWRELMTPDGLVGENWLLSYEARQQGWMHSHGGGDHRDSHPVLSQLAAAGVSFMDLSRSVTPSTSIATAALPHPHRRPLPRLRPLDLGTYDLCCLAGLHLRANRATIASFGDEEIVDLFEQVCDIVEPGADNPRKRATHAIQRLRDQRMLVRVDGAGVARAGEYAMTRSRPPSSSRT